MNIPPSEANRLSFYDYEMLLWNWNDAHDQDSDAPDPEQTIKRLAKINADPRLTGAAPQAVN